MSTIGYRSGGSALAISFAHTPERVLAPEVVRPQEAALEHVVVQLARLVFIEVRAAGLRHHHERAMVEQRVRQPDDHVVVLLGRSGG